MAATSPSAARVAWPREPMPTLTSSSVTLGGNQAIDRTHPYRRHAGWHRHTHCCHQLRCAVWHHQRRPRRQCRPHQNRQRHGDSLWCEHLHRHHHC
jgi:hypothetical protein